MRVIIAGSRDITNLEYLNRAIKNISWINPHFCLEIDHIISGKARGVDNLGERWAGMRNIPVIEMPADWNKGKSAGIIRNNEMAKIADFAIILWDGSSRGTLNMINTMKKHNKPYYLDVVI